MGSKTRPAPSPGPVSTEPRTDHHHDDTQDGPCVATARFAPLAGRSCAAGC